MAPAERFTAIIGSVLKACGLLEFHINHFIKTFGKDPILVKHIV
jgi:hypothetical protein